MRNHRDNAVTWGLLVAKALPTRPKERRKKKLPKRMCRGHVLGRAVTHGWIQRSSQPSSREPRGWMLDLIHPSPLICWDSSLNRHNWKPEDRETLCVIHTDQLFRAEPGGGKKRREWGKGREEVVGTRWRKEEVWHSTWTIFRIDVP